MVTLIGLKIDKEPTKNLTAILLICLAWEKLDLNNLVLLETSIDNQSLTTLCNILNSSTLFLVYLFYLNQ